MDSENKELSVETEVTEAVETTEEVAEVAPAKTQREAALKILLAIEENDFSKFTLNLKKDET